MLLRVLPCCCGHWCARFERAADAPVEPQVDEQKRARQQCCQRRLRARHVQQLRHRGRPQLDHAPDGQPELVQRRRQRHEAAWPAYWPGCLLRPSCAGDELRGLTALRGSPFVGDWRNEGSGVRAGLKSGATMPVHAATPITAQARHALWKRPWNCDQLLMRTRLSCVALGTIAAVYARVVGITG